MPKQNKQTRDGVAQQGRKDLDKANKMIAELPKPEDAPPRQPNADDPGWEITS